MNTKAQLRAEYKQKRIALDVQSRVLFNAKLLNHFEKWCAGRSFNCVMSYLPIERWAEIEMSPFEQFLKQKNPNLILCFPKIKGDQLLAVIPKDNNFHSDNSFGIKEPQHFEVISPKNIDLVFMPLLIMDEMGNRLGYGKGYYDRFLANQATQAFALGFSYFDPVASISDYYEGDKKLNACITPARIWSWESEV